MAIIKSSIIKRSALLRSSHFGTRLFGLESRLQPASTRTHGLAQLLDLAHDQGVVVPAEFEDTRMLTLFAGEYRYEFFAEETERPLEREVIHDQVVPTQPSFFPGSALVAATVSLAWLRR